MRQAAWLLAASLLGCAVSRGEPVGAQAPATRGGGPQAVWMDVDPAIGLPSREVDDGLALLQAFHSPEIAVRGVSLVFGNTSLENAVPIGRAVVERFGSPGLAVHPGAAGADQLGEETEAVRAMAAALEREPLVVLALGPVTNVGSLLRLHPELAGRIETLVMVAARRQGQSFRTGAATNTPHQDFNFELDPAAMQVILDSEVPVVFAPWEVSSQVWIRQADLDDLASRSAAGAWVAEQTASWIARWKENLGVDGFNPFDTLAVGWVSHPELIEGVEAAVWIGRDEDDRRPGSGVEKPYLWVDPERAGGRRALYLYRPAPAFQPLLLARLAGAP